MDEKQINQYISWSRLKKIWLLGDIVRGQVVGHRPYGIFVDLGVAFKGLVQITDFKPDCGIMSPEKYPPIGCEIEATILGFKEHGKQIWLKEI